MKALAILLVTAPFLRADFRFEETSRTREGSIAVTHLIKGNRMATVARKRITVIDLDRETITGIDLSKKTYTVTPFAQVKQAADKGKPGDAFKAEVNTGSQTKSIGVLNAKQTIFTITGPGAPGMQVESWIAPFPGFDEVRDFNRKLGEKLGYRFSLEVWQRWPEAQAEIEAAAQESNQLPGAPIEFVVKTEGPSSKVTRTELSGFTGAADASKFEVPAGFKQVDTQPAR